ncbi:19436_t:CDS:2 [Funneliformis geosporum]|uniref:19526_t:CDS:1 n=1 Tax=Funneliformis geosporum TaxID=1117311 RepID=A0A9W4T117_9GLOM|nr:19526_t:CDS:2 [Funneliformis geosporum]CAI2189119.1 19436_t:CDS:2 [Funneliformis geosporum]
MSSPIINSPNGQFNFAANSSPDVIGERCNVIERKAKAYFTKVEVAHCAEKQGSSETKDMSRAQWCTFIEAVGNNLGLPQSTICTAQLLYNRFFLFHPTKDFASTKQKTDLCITCLFVSTKIEETYKKLKDILVAAYQVKHPEGTEINAESQMLEEQRRRIIQNERAIVETICDKYLYLKAYNIVNEWFPPATIAAASIFIAAKLLHRENFPSIVHNIPWYKIFLARIDDIEESSSNPDDPANEEFTQLKLAISQQAKERDASMEDVIMNRIDMESNDNSFQMINGESKDHTVRYMFATIPEIHFV